MVAINIAGLLLIALMVWGFCLYKDETDVQVAGDTAPSIPVSHQSCSF